ncbi:type IV pili methyl-accepting chemotaxis transducer N-terminal domain-containing protein [Thermosulfidibacter takaii]|uniref:type IV pili methyl-accepting chemotaxis transducer N-terminal domain-containing protein n=1 Tax=Thermosulfidibacter takaii TaxID=412593 RepID=UPI0008383CA7|nr:type IV pili methyl-accepting chemotaxis transducer N-terminal domain-containing protein [Thermosulfidibacter takaii]
MSIKGKLLIPTIVMVMVNVIVVVGTVYTVSKQKNSAFIINMAGRQRMLTQKMSKEMLIYRHYLSINEAQKARIYQRNLISSMKVFDATLKALYQGGKIPVDLKMTTLELCQVFGMQPSKLSLKRF